MVAHAATVLQYMLRLKSQHITQGTTRGNASQSAVSLGLAPSCRAGVAFSEVAVLHYSSSLCGAAAPDSEQKLSETQSSAQKDACRQ